VFCVFFFPVHRYTSCCLFRLYSPVWLPQRRPQTRMRTPCLVSHNNNNSSKIPLAYYPLTPGSLLPSISSTALSTSSPITALPPVPYSHTCLQLRRYAVRSASAAPFSPSRHSRATTAVTGTERNTGRGAILQRVRT
jgi:hypothetical protein